ncbi:DUF2206 domain-containing protein [Methanococcus sp. CF]
MKILNPFKLQNWEYKKFLIVILGIQLSLLGLFGLNKLGVETPILRAFVGFIYISFVPGYIILRLLKLNKLDSSESFLYALILSIFTSMFLGFFVNSNPLNIFGEKPISEYSLLSTIAIFNFLITIASCFQNYNIRYSDVYLDLKKLTNLDVVLISIIPIIFLLGMYLKKYYLYNSISTLAILLLIIILMRSLQIKGKWGKYPILIYLLSISLILTFSLTNTFTISHDGEYTLAKETLDNGIYNSATFGTYYSTLSNNILPCIPYYLCNISLLSVYKIIFPIWLSILPLGIYLLSKQYLPPKESFLASFLTLFTGSLVFLNSYTISKQFFAELFLLLFLITTFQKDIPEYKKYLLYIISFFGIIWSHYGTAFLVLGLLLFLSAFEVFNIKKREFTKLLIIYVIFFLLWYTNISNGSLLYILKSISKSILENLSSEFGSTSTRGSVLITSHKTGISLLSKYLNLSIPFFILIGLIKSSLPKCRKFPVKYLLFSAYFYILMIFSVLIPKFSVMSPGRLYGLSMLTAMPFVILGSFYFFNILVTLSNKLPITISYSKIKTLFGLFFSIMILLNLGVVREFTNEGPISESLCNDFDALTFDEKAKIYANTVFEYDVYSSTWIAKYHTLNTIRTTVGYTGTASTFKNYASSDMKVLTFYENMTYSKKNEYIWILFANHENIAHGTKYDLYYSYNFNESTYYSKIAELNKIYSNGKSDILLNN